MADWLSQYTLALDLRDAHESEHAAYIDAYTKLADRTATTTNSSATDTTSTPGAQSPSPDLVTRLNADLRTAQKQRNDLQSQFTTVQIQVSALEAEARTSQSRITALERTNRDLERRLRDREEELRGKARLVESVQDEMVGLNLQMNMAEERATKLKGENEELVRRWVARMGEEVERMNVESRWE